MTDDHGNDGHGIGARLFLDEKSPIRHDPSGLNGEAKDGERESQEAVLLETPSHERRCDQRINHPLYMPPRFRGMILLPRGNKWTAESLVMYECFLQMFQTTAVVKNDYDYETFLRLPTKI